MSKIEVKNEIAMIKMKLLNSNITQCEYNNLLVALIALYESLAHLYE